MTATLEPDLVLHVGMQQSGAAMLQAALGRLRPQLRRHGVAFVAQPAIAALEHAGGQRNRAEPDLLAGNAFAKELRELVDDERRATSAVSGGTGPVLISSDVLLGAANLGLTDSEQFRPEAVGSLEQIITALGAERVRVVLVVHRQDRLMELSYLRDVQGGRFHTFAEQFPDRLSPHFDYVELVQRIAAVSNVIDVRVRPVELIADDPRPFVDDFLACVGLKGELDVEVVPSDLRLRRAFSQRGLKIALAMNPHLETPRDRERLRAFVLENFAAEDDRQTRFLEKEDRRQIVRAHRGSNRTLFATYLPDLPPDSYDTDDASRRLAEILPPVQPLLGVRARRLARRGVGIARAEARRGLAEVNRRRADRQRNDRQRKDSGGGR